ncbi:hypothetical protein BC833DRAFT_94213 [Globomyces pollinis-pini]|nr:hypothetical protein BC833DRAFT_94213 [Globomyces pollinis-pini]
MQNANLELTQAKEWNQRENVKLNDSFNDLEQSYKKREREMELLMIKLNELDSEKNKSNLRILKEREQFKIKLAEMKKEKQLVLDNLEQSYREVKFLKTTLNTKEEAFRDKIEHLIS